MQLDGFREIWKELDVISEQMINEFARFNRNEVANGINLFKDHHNRHKSYMIGGKEYEMSENEYDDNAHYLSSFPGIAIGTGTDIDVYGYITQDDKKVKFIEIPGGAFMVAYRGDDVSGVARTFFYTSKNELLYNANPYRKLSTRGRDHRYKSDLDGGFVGLNYFKPILGGNRGVTEEEAKTIKSDILSGRKISVK